MNDLSVEELNDRYYRWWTVFGWKLRNPSNYGIKLGPITLAVYEWDGWHLLMTVLTRPVIDTGLSAHRHG